MKTTIYTATIIVEDYLGKESIADNIYCASFATDEARQEWVDETYLDIVRERNADDEGHNWACHTKLSEQDIDIPVFIMTMVDHQDTDYNCGVYPTAYPTEGLAKKALRKCVKAELHEGIVKRVVFNHGLTNDENASIAESEDGRLGWTVDER